MIKLKPLIVFLFLVFSSSMATAQSTVGLFGGLNMSKLAGDAPANATYKNLVGANVGAYFDIDLGKGLFLGLQPSYSQEGTKISYTLRGVEEPIDSISIRLNYYSLPLILKVTSTNERFYALAGIETGMLLNSSIRSHDEKEDIETNVADWNLAMHFGAGIRIPVGFPRLFVELRYAQGIVNLTDEPLGEDNLIPRVKTSGFKIMTGIEIPLRKSNK